ncbi:MAG: hypothetical protein FJX34_02015 [Alphaproteobacteria bacterium]|nr:hypothetical protein [Alphaproteobacteria bacterium]
MSKFTPTLGTIDEDRESEDRESANEEEYGDVVENWFDGIPAGLDAEKFSKQVNDQVKSDPVKAKEAYGKIMALLSGDGEDKDTRAQCEEIWNIRKDVDDMALQTFADTVWSILQSEDTDISAEDKGKAIEALKKNFGFLGDDKARNAKETGNLTIKAASDSVAAIGNESSASAMIADVLKGKISALTTDTPPLPTPQVVSSDTPNILPPTPPETKVAGGANGTPPTPPETKNDKKTWETTKEVGMGLLKSGVALAVFVLIAATPAGPLVALAAAGGFLALTADNEKDKPKADPSYVDAWKEFAKKAEKNKQAQGHAVNVGAKKTNSGKAADSLVEDANLEQDEETLTQTAENLRNSTKKKTNEQDAKQEAMDAVHNIAGELGNASDSSTVKPPVITTSTTSGITR